MIWEILLSATIETGLGFLAEVGFGDAARDLRDRLFQTEQKKRQRALQQAFSRAAQFASDEDIEDLLKHRPFQEEVIKALLDPVTGLDIQAVAQYWGDKYPEHIISLRRFFNTLQNTLLEDKVWGDILVRYHSLRARPDVQKALQERQLPISDAPIVRAVSTVIAGNVTLAQGKGAVAMGEVGAYIGGDVHQIVQVTIQQFFGRGEAEQETSDLRRRYLNHVSNQANLLPWIHLTTDFAHPEHGASLSLADVFIDLDTTELESKHVDYEEELRQFLARQQETKRIPAQEIVNREPALLLMGDPGSGKSTLVKYLAYLMAQASLAEDPTPALSKLSGWNYGALLPLRVELRHLAAFALENPKITGCKLMLQYIHKDLADWGLEDCWHLLQEALQNTDGGMLILLDGLDEVPTSQRQLAVDAVNETYALHPGHRYLVTCRPYAYVGQPWRLHHFHQVTLAPFSEKQIDRFIDNWYERLAERQRLETQALAAQKARSLKEAVRRRDLLGLAERPLLLTIMAQLHAYAGQLPEDRTQLYADAVQLLLQRWEGRFESGGGLLEHMDIPGLKMSDLEEGLYKVAFNAQQGSGSLEETADIKEGDLILWLKPYLGDSLDKAEQFVNYIRERAGLLIRHKTEAYTFPHRSFQEFLAACHWLTLPDYPGQAARMVHEDWDRWREVFVLAAGHAARTKRLSQAVAAVNELLPCYPEEIETPEPKDFKAAALAARTLLEIGTVGVQRERAGPPLLKRNQSWLESALGRVNLLPPPERAEAGCLLGRLGDPRREALMVEAMQFCCVPSGEFWMGSKKGEGDDDERPRHRLTLPEFWIGRYPVSNAQFDQFVQAGGYRQASFWVEAQAAKIWRDGKIHLEWAKEVREGPPDFGEPFDLPNHPVVGVTWYEALAFARWLDERLRQAGVFLVLEPSTRQVSSTALPPGYRVTLPSEAEWEKAARGTDGRIYPWGKDPDPNRANYAETGIHATNPLGCFPGGANPYGVEEMSGNAWEWTRSIFAKYPYPEKSVDLAEREGLSAPVNAHRVLRGGSFYDDRGFVRCACRDWYNPDYGFDGIGFRVVVSPSVSGR